MDNAYNDYKGVKGWLLLLCVCLAILDPMAGIFNLMIITDVMRPYFDQDPALFNLVLVGGICNICLLVYSMYTGVSLWKVSLNAVIGAKKYFLILFHYSFISIFFPQLFGLSEKTQTEIYKMNPLNNVIIMLYAFIWYLYLRKSKRIKATYGEDGQTS